MSIVELNLWQDHWSLCHERLTALIELAKAPKVDLTPENITLLQQMMDIAIEAQEDCPVHSPFTRTLMIGLYGCGG